MFPSSALGEILQLGRTPVPRGLGGWTPLALFKVRGWFLPGLGKGPDLPLLWSVSLLVSGNGCFLLFFFLIETSLCSSPPFSSLELLRALISVPLSLAPASVWAPGLLLPLPTPPPRCHSPRSSPRTANGETRPKQLGSLAQGFFAR